jgi:hypothetical protein
VLREATLPRAWLVPFVAFVVVSFGESAATSVNMGNLTYLLWPVRAAYGVLVLVAVAWLVVISAQDATPKRSFWYGFATGAMCVAAMLAVDLPYANKVYHAAGIAPVGALFVLTRLPLVAAIAGLVLGTLVAAVVRLVQGRQR